MVSLMTHAPLNRIHTIMVNTTLPANIGSASRAMHTMGLSHLTVVAPRLPIDDTSYANSAGGSCVLDNAIIAPTIETALAPHSLIFMASARTRHMPKPVISPAQSATLIHDFLTKNQQATIALVFGREDRGLTNDELAMADYHIQIPANPAYPVLNVASSVQVIASFIYAHFDAQSTHERSHQDYNQHNSKHALDVTYRTEWDEPSISHAQRVSLDEAVIELMVKLNLAHDEDLKDLPKRLTRLSSRLQLDQKEYAMIRALMAKISTKLH